MDERHERAIDGDAPGRAAASPGSVEVPPAAPWWERPAPGGPGGGGFGAWQPWYGPPPPRHRRRWPWLLVALVTSVAVAAAVGIGYLTGRLGGDSQSRVASAVDPGVVDIDSTLAGGTGLAAGTGMIIRSDGMVLTNNHVIAGSAALTVHLSDGSTHPARVVGDDPAKDIALVRIIGVSGLPTVHFMDSSQASVGQHVYIIGNALGRGGRPKITGGTVSQLGETITARDPTGATETLHNMIQIDGLIQSGDSGGPLASDSGQVIGMDTAGAGTGSSAPTSAHLGFAIPTDTARAIAAKIEAGQAVDGIEIGPGPFIGVEVRDAAGVPRAPVSSGAYVAQVQPGTPAAGVGIAAGDVIVSLGGHRITSDGDLADALRADRRGQRVSLGWVDGSGAPHGATITLAAGPPG